MSFLKGGLLSTVAAGSIAAAVSVPVHAQEQVNPNQSVTERTAEGYNPIGMPVGSFRFFPKVEVEEEYNDNIHKSNDTETDDFITKVEPKLRLGSDWNQHLLQLEAGAEIGRYASSEKDDYEDYNLGARGRYDASKALNFNGIAKFLHEHEERGGNDVGTDAAAPIEYDQMAGELGVTYKPNRLSVGFRATADDYDYDDNATLSGGVANNDDRDRFQTLGEVRIGYEIQDGYEAYFKSSYNDRDYDSRVDDQGVDRDSDGYKMQAGIAIDLDRLIRADLAAGWMEQDYADASLENADGYSLDARIRWNLTELTTVRGTASRTINETTITGASATIDSNLGVGVDHELLRNLVLTADLKYGQSDFEGITREDDKYTASVGIDYKLNRNFYTRAKYQFEERDSNQNANDYDQNVFTITLGAQF